MLAWRRRRSKLRLVVGVLGCACFAGGRAGVFDSAVEGSFCWRLCWKVADWLGGGVSCLRVPFGLLCDAIQHGFAFSICTRVALYWGLPSRSKVAQFLTLVFITLLPTCTGANALRVSPRPLRQADYASSDVLNGGSISRPSLRSNLERLAGKENVSEISGAYPEA